MACYMSQKLISVLALFMLLTINPISSQLMGGIGEITTRATTVKDPCCPNPCKNHGECVASGSSFSCICPRTATGSLCENCACQNGGTCVHQPGEFSPDSCQCPRTYSGFYCQLYRP